MDYLEIIKRNNELGKKLEGTMPYKIGVLSNIILHQLKEPLELALRSNKINAVVEFGDYDNIAQDSVKFQSHNALILFWEAANIVDGLHYKSLSMTGPELEALIEKVKLELNLVIKSLEKVPVVVMNKFSSLLFNQYFIRENNFDYLVNTLNKYLEETLPANFLLLDIGRIIAQNGARDALNKRFWYSSKMLYTVDLLKTYAGQAAPVFLNILGKSKKALIMDCDNTLWKGIIGEDLIDGIAYSANQKDGVYFEEVQYLAKSLLAQGTILGINSKNNPGDVDAVLAKEDMTLKDADFPEKKVNWNDKVSNLKEIAEELNIGLDSLVQMDDSDFEINYIKTELPAVETIQVPKSASEYPEAFRRNMNLFFNLKTTREDTSRTKMYKEQQQRDDEKNKFNTLEDYLQSLELEISINLNNTSEIPRIAQMTQKTNQFNLTTRRYTEGEIKNMIEGGKHYIFSFSLKDKFGDYGITGLCIAKKGDAAGVIIIDNLLMSCRIIGRNIEKAFFNYLILFLEGKGFKEVKSAYLKTLKNTQVENLYDQFGMKLISSTEEEKSYLLNIVGYHPSPINYVTVKNGK